MIKFICNKISYDKTVENMKKAGITAHYTLLEAEALCDALKKKLIEEAHEVTHATDRTEVLSELADVLMIIKGLCKAYKISHEEFEAAQQEKQATRGCYDTGLFISSIEMEETNPWVQHFRKSPEKYPEIL